MRKKNSGGGISLKSIELFSDKKSLRNGSTGSLLGFWVKPAWILCFSHLRPMTHQEKYDLNPW
jgi:hypothetical protein